ncbi:hypothetical protein EJ06DRAFT_402100 [Trichodelitschia bisporula]|uniref:Uncharacterized protein n=1 Tax=Trichodelitschia bisporula TaxID=703511 RepID=A0A6G1HX88_9PEZI|nr:hypothetical protein EJ06DRAFT_402100 [Trichodelitschia bisporula]
MILRANGKSDVVSTTAKDREGDIAFSISLCPVKHATEGLRALTASVNRSVTKMIPVAVPSARPLRPRGCNFPVALSRDFIFPRPPSPVLQTWRGEYLVPYGPAGKRLGQTNTHERIYATIPLKPPPQTRKTQTQSHGPRPANCQMPWRCLRC